MGKVLATISALLLIWVMYPHVRRGEFIAPTPIAPGTWMADYVSSHNQDYLATPPQGYGWFRFDVWNNPPPGGRTVYQDDFKLKW
jgi:hypothetical protein